MSAINLNSTTGIVLANTSNGPQTVVLPVASTIAGRVFYVKDAFGTFLNNPLTLSTSAGDTFQGGATTFDLNIPFQTQQFIAASSIAGWNWYSLNGSFQENTIASTITTSSLTVNRINGNPVVTQAGNTLNITGVQQTAQGVAFLSTPNIQIYATGSQTYAWDLNMPLSTINGSPVDVYLTSNDSYRTYLVEGGNQVIFYTSNINTYPMTFYIKNIQSYLGENVEVTYSSITSPIATGVSGTTSFAYKPFSNGSGQITNTATQILQWDGTVLTMY